MQIYIFEPEILSLAQVSNEEFKQFDPDPAELTIFFEPSYRQIMILSAGKPIEDYYFHVFSGELLEDVSLGLAGAKRYLNAYAELRPSLFRGYEYSISAMTGEKYYHADDKEWTCPSTEH